MNKILMLIMVSGLVFLSPGYESTLSVTVAPAEHTYVALSPDISIGSTL